jgi:putative transposase
LITRPWEEFAWFLRRAIKWNGTPEKITIDKSGANTAAIESHNAEHEAGIEIRQIKYLNNIVETGSSGHQAVGATNAGVQILQISRGDACWYRTHAHDPERPVADDRRNVPGTAILFVGGIIRTYPSMAPAHSGNLRQNPPPSI